MSKFHFLDTLVDVQLSGEDTGGAYAVCTMLVPPGHQPPPHVHAHDSEAFTVLEGEIAVHTPDGAVVVRAGESLHAPAGVPHTYAVTSDVPARIVLTTVPAGFDRFVAAFGTPTESSELPGPPASPPDVEALAAAAAAEGITLLGPPGVLPRDLPAQVSA